MLDGELRNLLESMPLSDPSIVDIRQVRAIDKARFDFYPFMPHVMYVETLHRRNYHRVFENSFSEPMTLRKENHGRAYLTSKKEMK